MAHPLQAHYEHVAALLQPLRAVFDTEAAHGQQREFFDELLAANELEIALHLACSFLLDSLIPVFDASVLARIETAHRAMDLHDDCVEKLRSISSQ